MADACGLAGGTPWGSDAPEEGRYKNTSFAHHGMKGTELPELPTGVQWKIGGEAEVTWQIRNNHGGGYSYRLCPRDQPLTEGGYKRTNTFAQTHTGFSLTHSLVHQPASSSTLSTSCATSRRS